VDLVAGVEFGPVRVKFPMFTTFDSFAPPQLQKKVSGKSWADVDLSAVKEKLSAVIEEAKAKDPKELKSRIIVLEKDLAAAMKGAAKPLSNAPAKTKEVCKTVEKLVVKDGQIERLEKLQTRAEEKFAAWWKQAAEKLNPVIELLKGQRSEIFDLRTAIAGAVKDHGPGLPGVRSFGVPQDDKPAVVPRTFFLNEQHETRGFKNRPSPQPSPASTRERGPNGDAPSLGKAGKRRMMIALAQNPDGLTLRKLSILTGIARTGGTWRIYLGELRGAGWVQDLDDGDGVRATEEGLRVLGDFKPLPTGAKLIAYWQEQLGNSGKRKIFDEIVAAYPNSLPAQELSDRTGIAMSGGTWRIYLGELRGLELIEGKTDLKASRDLFT
jgi:hypothetical protein